MLKKLTLVSLVFTVLLYTTNAIASDYQNSTVTGLYVLDVTIDGDDKEWTAASPQITDVSGDQVPGHEGIDIRSCTVAINPQKDTLFFLLTVEGETNDETNSLGYPLVEYLVGFDSPGVESSGRSEFDWQIGFNFSGEFWVWDLRGDKDYDDSSNLTNYPAGSVSKAKFAKKQVIEFSVPLSHIGNITVFKANPYLVLQEDNDTFTFADGGKPFDDTLFVDGDTLTLYESGELELTATRVR